jgi:uncharacterized protein
MTDVLPPTEQKALILLLYAPGTTGTAGEPIVGKTRLMKEVFLLDFEGSSAEPLLHVGPFIPYKYGPFSAKVASSLDDLLNEGFVQKEGEDPGARYVLTPRGLAEGQSIWTQIPVDAKKDLLRVKALYNGQPLTQLLHYVYAKYPEYAIESELRDRLAPIG